MRTWGSFPWWRYWNRVVPRSESHSRLVCNPTREAKSKKQLFKAVFLVFNIVYLFISIKYDKLYTVLNKYNYYAY